MKKLTVVLLETEGALVRMTAPLAEANINIIDMDAEEIDNIGVAHISVDDADFEAAFHALRNTGHQVMPVGVLLVKIDDKPGAMAKLAVLLADAKVNVRSMRIVRREDGYSLAAIVPEPIDMAKAVLAENVVG